MLTYIKTISRPLYILMITLICFVCHEALAQPGNGSHPHHPPKHKKNRQVEEVTESISVYPSPVVKYMEIEVIIEEEEDMTGCNGGLDDSMNEERDTEEAIFYISDLEGVSYFKGTIKPLPSGRYQIDLGDYENGVYVLRKVTGDRVSYARFVVEH